MYWVDTAISFDDILKFALTVFICLDNANKVGLNSTYAPEFLFKVNVNYHGVYDDGANVLNWNENDDDVAFWRPSWVPEINLNYFVIDVVFELSIVKFTLTNLWNLMIRPFTQLTGISDGCVNYNISLTLIVNGIATFITILGLVNASFT